MTIPLQLGIRAHDFGQIPLAELIGKLDRYGLRHIQFAVQKSFPESSPSLTGIHQGTAAYFGEAFRTAGIRIAVLGCYINMVAEDPEERAKELERYAVHLRLASGFGAPLVGTESGSLGSAEDNHTEQVFQQVVQSVTEMVREAERWGATVGIEPVAYHPLHSARLTKRLLDLVPSNHLQVILDSVNLLTPENFAKREQIVAEALELLGDRIAVLHLKDCVLDQGSIRSVPIGRGDMNFAPLLRFMKAGRPLLQGIMEETQEADLPHSIAYLQRKYEEV